MKRLAGKRITTALVALIVGLVAASAAHAQTVITGRVTNEQGAPIAGANVAIPSLSIRGEADASGNYRLTVPADRAGQSVTVVGRFIGFSQAQRTVTLTSGAQTLDFSLTADPFNLTEVIVTGVATGTEQRKLPFTVAHVSDEQVQQGSGLFAGIRSGRQSCRRPNKSWQWDAWRGAFDPSSRLDQPCNWRQHAADYCRWGRDPLEHLGHRMPMTSLPLRC